jgi:hypothetical protein
VRFILLCSLDEVVASEMATISGRLKRNGTLSEIIYYMFTTFREAKNTFTTGVH